MFPACFQPDCLSLVSFSLLLLSPSSRSPHWLFVLAEGFLHVLSPVGGCWPWPLSGWTALSPSLSDGWLWPESHGLWNPLFHPEPSEEESGKELGPTQGGCGRAGAAGLGALGGG